MVLILLSCKSHANDFMLIRSTASLWKRLSRGDWDFGKTTVSLC
ncbi:hypothetical protein HMPREF0322_04236 [Desulfitobacterium hafniense DP7]|uniref:Uncharacterized protein n=1 Tax=Desulfitobacterium hafniense DP7 TaxID=537010 RepID=G9XTC9_DESHA|nr:hypothetical protein HMPREF0322_04236 [Desulfitobacterium hafniense DP7]